MTAMYRCARHLALLACCMPALLSATPQDDTSWKKLSGRLQNLEGGALGGILYYDPASILTLPPFVTLEILVDNRIPADGRYDFKKQYSYKSERFTLRFDCHEKTFSLSHPRRYAGAMAQGSEFLDIDHEPWHDRFVLADSAVKELRGNAPGLCR